MTAPLIRAAVVGCGRVSRTAHYSSLKENEDFDFVAVCDTDSARADEWAQKNNVGAYHDIDELLDRENLDFVTINAPNGLHPQLAVKAAERGVNVMCEKPLGMSLAEVDSLIETCDRAGVKLYTVLQNRFNATNQLLKQAVDKGRFGKMLTCSVTLRWHRGLPYYQEDNGWRGNPEMAGGVFTNQAVHYIDMMEWLVGAPPQVVFSCMDTAVHPIEVETHGCAVIRFANGVIGNLNLTALNFPDDKEGSITILGDSGTVRVGGKSMNMIEEWEFASPDTETDELARNSDFEPPTVYGFGHQEMYRRIGRQLRHGEDAGAPDGREGRKSVAFLDALYRSAKTGDPVAL